MSDIEKLGAFYLGMELSTGEAVLYDARDLTTHGLCVGMTGSGKTGLCLALIEEALIDGVPVIAIDPKGDLGNLALTFPELRPEDFAPWVEPGKDPATVAQTWRSGLAASGQSGDRIARLRAAATSRSTCRARMQACRSVSCAHSRHRRASSMARRGATAWRAPCRGCSASSGSRPMHRSRRARAAGRADRQAAREVSAQARCAREQAVDDRTADRARGGAGDGRDG